MVPPAARIGTPTAGRRRTLSPDEGSLTADTISTGGNVPPARLRSCTASVVGVMLGVALAGGRGFLGRCRAVRRRAMGRGLTAALAARVRSRMAGLLAPAGPAGLLAAAIVLVHGRPGPALGFLLGDATLLIALGDVIGLALLLVGVFR